MNDIIIQKKNNMVTQFKDLDLNGTYSFADYLTWKFTERVEIIKGKLFKMAMPTEKHQRVSGNLYRQFANYLYKKPCRVYHPPFDVRLIKPPHQRKPSDKSIYTIVQPDITVVCDMFKIDPKGCLGAPDLIIEILSPSTGSKDLKDKKEVYEFEGVKEYWIVSPEDETVIVYWLNEQGVYVLNNIYANIDTIKSFVFPDFDVDLKDVFDIYD